MRFPVSFSQQRLWFLDQLEPGVPTYNMPYAMWLDGPLDSRALQRAMDAMAARHAVLRTSIVAFDGVPEQGARYLLRRDPLTAGKALFGKNCATCHSYSDEFKDDSGKFVDLYQVNRGVLKTPEELPAGTVLIVPEVMGTGK